MQHAQLRLAQLGVPTVSPASPAGCWGMLSSSVETETSVQALFCARQPQIQGAAAPLRIQSMVKIENAATLHRFQSSSVIHNDPISAHQQRCDALLFHGCPADVAANIQATGLLLQHASNGMLGQGLYGATDPRKSVQYCRTQDKFMFVCRFNLSNAQHAGPFTQHRNSVFDEYCVYDERHIVVLWMLKVC